MVQVHTCVSVHCDQCGDPLGSPGFEAHWPTEDAALDAAAADGWQIGPGGRLWCSACGPVLTCEAEGHQFSAWRHPTTPDEQPAGSKDYRHCQRCCLHESRLTIPAISNSARAGEPFTTARLVSGAEVAGEVA